MWGIFTFVIHLKVTSATCCITMCLLSPRPPVNLKENLSFSPMENSQSDVELVSFHAIVSLVKFRLKNTRLQKCTLSLLGLKR